MSQENAELIRRVEAAWDESKLDALDSLFAPNFVSHTLQPGAPPGLVSAKEFHQLVMTGMPDRKVEIVDLIASGNRVVVRCHVTGTNTGGLPMFGVEPNGRKVDSEWISIYRVEDGKVAEHWAAADSLGVLQQLGKFPQAA